MSSNKLFHIFAGVYVEFVLKNLKGAQVMEDGGRVEGSVILSGYLLDEDQDYYYLGETQEDISQAIKKEDVIRIYKPEDEILADMGLDYKGDTH